MLYNLTNGKIIIRRDVKFNEAKAWDWGAQEEEHNTHPLYEECCYLDHLTSMLLPGSSNLRGISSAIQTCKKGGPTTMCRQPL